MITNITEILERTVGKHADKTALFGERKSENLTFVSLLQKARAAGCFMLDRGITGMAVLIAAKKAPSTVAAMLGCVYGGNLYSVRDVITPDAVFERIIRILSPAIIIYDDTFEKTVNKMCGNIQTVHINKLFEHYVSVKILSYVTHTSSEPLCVSFTSGSTGEPKGVVATQGNVIEYADNLCETLGFCEDSIFANQAPLGYDASLKELLPVIKCGASAYFAPRKLFSFPHNLIKYLNENKINTTCFAASVYAWICASGALDIDIPEYLQTAVFGGECLPRAAFDCLRRKLPTVALYNLYGVTEATGMSTFWRAERELSEGERIPIGQPFKNTKILLLAEGREAVAGEVGEIYIGGSKVTQGYYNNPESTARVFVNNPLNSAFGEKMFRTGDLAYRNTHGELVYVSRTDDTFKRMGERVCPSEIAAVAEKIQSVSRAVCIYSEERGKLALFFSGDAGENTVGRVISDSLPRYMRPDIIRRTEKIYINDNGKVDKEKLWKSL